ncbi:hypothetical protein FIBSPDRAFT_881087 [Athelia psychrophila]|uniref:Uncharacterized protein n=1 Tax=Athelia psychrophila TaxID=1759441 RepID=A0A166XA00_9AGAM|nr:hypothetical protein FIBSPDRAFT_881087 [Fibularhizoctonia sp. CBS 109695]
MYVTKELAELMGQLEGLEGDAELAKKKEIEAIEKHLEWAANRTIQVLDINKLHQDDLPNLPPSSKLSGPAPNLTASASALTPKVKAYASSNGDAGTNVFNPITLLSDAEDLIPPQVQDRPF